jgi:DNA-binding transcriptional MocR family regulator
VLSGSQQGIDLLARTLIMPGDAVLVEGPSYPAALSAFRFAGARVHQLKTDAEGIVIEGLESALSSLKPKLLYTVPTFGNPSGSTLSLERRRRLLELVVHFGCLLVEDDPYGELWFESPAPAPIRAMRSEFPGAEQYCIYLSSLSKTVAPALRLGWMLAPAEIRRACVLAKQTDDMHASTFTQALAAAYLAEGSFDRHLPFLRARYGSRARALTAALRNRLGQQVEFVEPAGGMFVWVRIPGIDTSKLLPEAIQRNVLFVPGAAFFSDQHDGTWLRLSFASQDENGLKDGIDRLTQAIETCSSLPRL